MTIIHNYMKKQERESGEQREGRGEKKEERRDKNAKQACPRCDTRPVASVSFIHITSELQMTIHLLQTQDNIVRNQELEYSEGLRPPLRGGVVSQMLQDGKGNQEVPASCKASSNRTGHTPCLSGSQTLDGWDG